VLDGVQIPQGKAAFFVQPTEKHHESLLRCTQQKSITASARLQQRTALPLTAGVTLTFRPLRPLVKIRLQFVFPLHILHRFRDIISKTYFPKFNYR